MKRSKEMFLELREVIVYEENINYERIKFKRNCSINRK